MKIALLTRYFNFTNAGIGRVSMEIFNRLLKRGYDVMPFCVGGESLAAYFKYTAWELARKMPERCDVYHALTPMEAIWMPKENSVVTFHDLILMTHPKIAVAGLGYHPLKLAIARLCFSVAAKVARKARVLACNSDATALNVAIHLGADRAKTRVVKLGIREDLEPKGRKWASDRLRIGYLGQLDRRKRVELLINAFKLSRIDAELCVAGIGADRDRLVSLAGADPRIKFLGLVPDDELCDFYNSLDVFCFPTAVEGFGLPILEAMACQKAVVVLEDAVIPLETKERCFRTDNLVNFFRNLPDFSFDGLEENYRFAKSHSWERCVDQYEQIYQEISA